MQFRQTTADEVALIHDFYFSSPDCNFSDFLNIRALTRKENHAAIRGLESHEFDRKGEVIEAVQPNILYEEYIYPIKS